MNKYKPCNDPYDCQGCGLCSEQTEVDGVRQIFQTYIADIKDEMKPYQTNLISAIFYWNFLKQRTEKLRLINCLLRDVEYFYEKSKINKQ
jgi:MinD superfamily P-loop ATPase